MRILITGATGFLGQYIVAEAVRRGHDVTVLVRPSRRLVDHHFPDAVTVVRADLRSRESLSHALDEIDSVIHLAACVVGDDDSQFASTVVGTENLLEVMVKQRVTKLIHCSTFSVYDWQQPGNVLDEDSSLEPNLYSRDGYAISKTWQERLVRRVADENDWQLTVLRPGFIWGAGNEVVAGIGQSLGTWHFVIGGSRPLPLTYVENCADCFLTALESPVAIGETYNVIDTDTVTAWQFMRQCIEAGVVEGRRLYVPYWMGIAVAQTASWVSRLFFGSKGKLPGLFVPIKFRARFRPLQFPNRRARKRINWHSKYTVRAAWNRIKLGEQRLLAAEAVRPNQNQTQPEESLV